MTAGEGEWVRAGRRGEGRGGRAREGGGRTLLCQLLQPRFLLADERDVDAAQELWVTANPLRAVPRATVSEGAGEGEVEERKGSERTMSSFLTRSCKVVRNGAIELSGSLQGGARASADVAEGEAREREGEAKEGEGG